MPRSLAGRQELPPGAVALTGFFVRIALFEGACESARRDCMVASGAPQAFLFHCGCCCSVTLEAEMPREHGPTRLREAVAQLNLSNEVASRLLRDDYTQSRVATGERHRHVD